MKLILVGLFLLSFLFAVRAQQINYYAWKYIGEGDFDAYKIEFDYNRQTMNDTLSYFSTYPNDNDIWTVEHENVIDWEKIFATRNYLDLKIIFQSVNDSSVTFYTEKKNLPDGYGSIWIRLSFYGKNKYGIIKGIMKIELYHYDYEKKRNVILSENQKISFRHI